MFSPYLGTLLSIDCFRLVDNRENWNYYPNCVTSIVFLSKTAHYNILLYIRQDAFYYPAGNFLRHSRYKTIRFMTQTNLINLQFASTSSITNASNPRGCNGMKIRSYGKHLLVGRISSVIRSAWTSDIGPKCVGIVPKIR